MRFHARETGGILLVALVLLAVIMIFLSAVSGVIIAQRHALAENIRTTEAFHLADAGFEYLMSLLNSSQCTPQRLVNQTIHQSLTDPETQQPIGTYSLHLVRDQGKFVATSIGETVSPPRCQALQATLTEQPGRYDVTWQPQGTVTCPSPAPITDPSCG